MKNYNSEYFVLGCSHLYGAPLLDWDQKSTMFYQGTHVNVMDPIKLKLGHPLPREPIQADYLCLPKPVFSQKIQEVITPLDLNKIQLIPAKIRVEKGVYWDYWYFHNFNVISCIDIENSEVEISDDEEDFGEILGFDTMLLKNDKIDKIPLEDRLVFTPKENPSYQVFHESVVEKINSISPSNLFWTSMEDWDVGYEF